MAMAIAVCSSDSSNETICSDTNDCYPKIFVPDPTGQFKEIRPGQELPPGLHIRMNLETHVREAKLIQDSETSIDSGVMTVEEAPKTNFVSDKVQSFKGFLPKETKDYLSQLIHKVFVEDNDPEETAFSELEAESHSYDFGVILFNKEDFERLSSALYIKNIRSKACIILGNSLQNHSECQSIAMEYGLLAKLSQLLDRPTSPVPDAEELLFIRRLLFLLACLSRGNKAATEEFFQGTLQNSLEILFAAVKDTDIRIKIIQVLGDVFVDATSNFPEVSAASTRKESLLLLELIEKLSKQRLPLDVIDFISNLLKDIMSNLKPYLRMSNYIMVTIILGNLDTMVKSVKDPGLKEYADELLKLVQELQERYQRAHEDL